MPETLLVPELLLFARLLLARRSAGGDFRTLTSMVIPTESTFNTSRRSGWTTVVACLFIATASGSLAENTKVPTKDGPRVLVALPLAISPGETKSLLIRGLKLDQATTVQFPDIEPAVEVRILKQEKSAPPDKLESMDVGDTLVEVTFVLPAEFAAESLPLTVTTPDGITSHFSLLVVPADRLTPESEPNDSLRKPQTVTLGQTISGIITQPKDVDVYEFAGQAGQSFAAEVFAARRGSPSDIQLTLFDSAGQILSIIDDTPQSRDPAIHIQLPRDDSYRLAVLDASDRGSSLSAYLLQIRVEQ